MISVALIGLVFMVLSVASIIETCRIDQVNPYYEIINFDHDPILVNLALIGLTALAFIVLMRRNFTLSKVDTRFIIFIMLIVTTIVSLVWINLVQSKSSGDAMILLNTAKDAAQDNYRSFLGSYDYYGNFSYYLYYPFQLGYVFFAELLYRIFGVGSSDLLFQIPNVIALDFVYVGIVMITKRIFGRKSLTNMTAIALTVCLQPMFMTTFTYGIIIGLAFSVWSVFFTVKYMQENKLWTAGVAVLLISISVLLKYNNMIVMAAMVIALILHTIGTKRFLALAAAALMVAGSIGLQKLVIFSYSQRSGVKLETQVSQTLYAYMGISESQMAPGWYSGISMTTLRDAALYSQSGQLDKAAVAAADKTAREGIKYRLDYLSKNNMMFEFYRDKLISQLNEPAFESIWLSQVRNHDLKSGEKLSDLVTSVYSGGLSKLLDHWFNYYNMIIYIGFTAGMAFMIIRRKKMLTPAAIILPTAVLGGVLYHLIFEAKSQYLLPYFIMLIPFAMYGLLESTHALTKVTSFLFKKQDDAPIDKPVEEPIDEQIKENE